MVHFKGTPEFLAQTCAGNDNVAPAAKFYCACGSAAGNGGEERFFFHEEQAPCTGAPNFIFAGNYKSGADSDVEGTTIQQVETLATAALCPAGSTFVWGPTCGTSVQCIEF